MRRTWCWCNEKILANSWMADLMDYEAKSCRYIWITFHSHRKCKLIIWQDHNCCPNTEVSLIFLSAHIIPHSGQLQFVQIRLPNIDNGVFIHGVWSLITAVCLYAVYKWGRMIMDANKEQTRSVHIRWQLLHFLPLSFDGNLSVYWHVLEEEQEEEEFFFSIYKSSEHAY